MADNIRSIPSVVDGLKPGQRKVIFGCFKRKLKNEIKVSIWVSELNQPNVSLNILYRSLNLLVTFLKKQHTTMEKRV